LLVGQHSLDARHLLDLEPHRVGVLEGDGEEIAELDPAALLHLDDAAPELLAFPLVFPQILDVFESELAHHHSSDRP
jgi:hypothetical protein